MRGLWRRGWSGPLVQVAGRGGGRCPPPAAPPGVLALGRGGGVGCREVEARREARAARAGDERVVIGAMRGRSGHSLARGGFGGRSGGVGMSRRGAGWRTRAGVCVRCGWVRGCGTFGGWWGPQLRVASGEGGVALRRRGRLRRSIGARKMWGAMGVRGGIAAGGGRWARCWRGAVRRGETCGWGGLGRRAAVGKGVAPRHREGCARVHCGSGYRVGTARVPGRAGMHGGDPERGVRERRGRRSRPGPTRDIRDVLVALGPSCGRERSVAGRQAKLNTRWGRGRRAVWRSDGGHVIRASSVGAIVAGRGARADGVAGRVRLSAPCAALAAARPAWGERACPGPRDGAGCVSGRGGCRGDPGGGGRGAGRWQVFRRLLRSGARARGGCAGRGLWPWAGASAI